MEQSFSNTDSNNELRLIRGGLSFEPGHNNLLDLANQITISLQTTLVVDKQIKLSFDAIRSFFELDGMHYQHEAEHLRIRIGRMSKHSCKYQLSSQGEDYGQITFARAKRWAEEDLLAIEKILERLVWPLRNALSYQKAMNHAMFDHLTGVGNRLALETHLEREISFAERYKTDLTLVMLDVDHFKRVNDLHGHDKGDEVLIELAQRLDSSLRRTDALFRFGGEEFTLIMPRTQIASGRFVAERLLRTINSQPIAGLPITISMGLSQWHSQQSPRELLRCADSALYDAKHHGRNCVRAG